MNEIIDFLQKEDSSVVKKFFKKKENIVVKKDLEKKIEIAKKHEDRINDIQKGLISVKTKPLKQIKRKKEIIWL